jgi:cell pole-organizing protein PopZ
MSDPRSEPSMEDILASIKRIIADDSPLPRRNFSPPPGPTAAAPIPVPQMPPPAAPESQKLAERWAESRPPFPPREPAAPEPADDSILELTNHIPNISPPPRARVDEHVWPMVQPDPAPADSRSEPPAVRRVVERLRQSEAASSQARAASVAAVASIAEPAAASHAGPSLSSLIINPAGTGQTLEGLVRDMLRPMLSDWIDTNLPGIVERLVKQEMSGVGDDQL